MPKTSQLQIRLSPRDKARLKRLARQAGQDLSAYVLERVLPPPAGRFREILAHLSAGGEHRYALAELHDLLTDLPPAGFAEAVARPTSHLSAFLMNYVAAMVEHAARAKGVPAPAWTGDIPPLDDPVFGTDLPSLRMHLLRSSPVAFKRRNIFVDAAIGERVQPVAVAQPVKLTKADIVKCFELLDEELASAGIQGELCLVGGAVMCLALDARAATRDVDAYFRPTRAIREAAARVAAKADVPPKWLNDAVRAYLSPHGDFGSFLEFSSLKVFVAAPGYLLAMKCAALRLGEEFHDLDDVRYLLRYLNLTSVEDALSMVTKYVPESQLLPKTRLALEELLPSTQAG